MPCLGPGLLCLLCAVAGAGSRIEADRSVAGNPAWAPPAPVEPEAPADMVCEDDLDPDDPVREPGGAAAPYGRSERMPRPNERRQQPGQLRGAPVPFDPLVRLSRLQV